MQPSSAREAAIIFSIWGLAPSIFSGGTRTVPAMIRVISSLLQPGLGEGLPRLEVVNLGRLLQGLADGVEALQQLLLAAGVDVETEPLAGRRDDGLARQVDG